MRGFGRILGFSRSKCADLEEFAVSAVTRILLADEMCEIFRNSIVQDNAFIKCSTKRKKLIRSYYAIKRSENKKLDSLLYDYFFPLRNSRQNNKRCTLPNNTRLP